MNSNWLHWIFWASAFCVFYAYVGYAATVAVLAALRPRPLRPMVDDSLVDGPISLIIAGYNEEPRIESRISELAARAASRPAGGELIVISDGSTDATEMIAMKAAATAEALAQQSGSELRVRVIGLAKRGGKAAALNAGLREAKHPIVIFADVRQRWAADALDELTAPFADPEVGAVSGDLILESEPGVMAAVGLYWRYEKWLRRMESQSGTMVSVTGAIAAVRRELAPELPVGLVLDDVYWPLAVVRSGRRVIHQESARAFDQLPPRPRDEFRRKVRTLAGNFQLVALAPWLLSPFQNPVWWRFASHRMMRLVAPWALLAMLASSSAAEGGVLRAAFWGQVVCYGVALAGCGRPVAAASRAASAAASFLILNAAAWLAFWVWATGRSARSWTKVRYGDGS